MGRNERVLASIADPRVRTLLTRLHREADRQTFGLLRVGLPQLPRLLLGRGLSSQRMEHALSDKYIPLEPAQGMLCYLLARSLRAQRIVEFGTSFGVSTIYLAMAVRDGGGGRVIGTELLPAKAAKARQHLEEAGLADFVEIREGNALETLRSLEGPVDFFLNDGFPRFALDVLKLVAPHLREGAIVLADNVGLFRAEHADYLAWVRDPANGFASGVLALAEDVELSVRVAGALDGQGPLRNPSV
jgi:predicted O-methyltransferase YrrM